MARNFAFEETQFALDFEEVEPWVFCTVKQTLLDAANVRSVTTLSAPLVKPKGLFERLFSSKAVIH